MYIPDYSKCLVCSNPPVLQWERWGSPEEIAYYINEGELPEGSTEVKFTVVACENHKVSDDESLRVHDFTCITLPCSCSQSDSSQGE